MVWQRGEMESLQAHNRRRGDSRLVARWLNNGQKKIPAIKAGIQKIGLECLSQHLEGKGLNAINLQQVMTNSKVARLDGLP